MPVTKLGRLVKHGFIRSFEEIYTYSLPIKGNAIGFIVMFFSLEVGIVDHLV